jgi:putative ABC transport system permease protein
MRDSRIRPGVFKLLRLTFGSDRYARADADAELDAYIESRVEHHMAQGMTPDDARAEALASLGAPLEEVRHRLHSSTIHRETRMRNRERFEHRWKDVSFALRSLRNSPIFALTAILTIALGIGATTAIFSVVNSVLLRPLPYADPDRLAFIWMDIRARGVPDSPIPPGDLPDLIQQAPAFADIAGLTIQLRATFLANDARPEMILNAHVTPNFFSVLGTHIALGRNFVATDGAPSAPAAGADSSQVPARLPEMTILTDAFWRSHFGADSSIIGKTVRVNDRDALIIGVTPPSFQLVYNASAAASGPPVMYQALRMDYSTASRNTTSFTMIGRLRAGATWNEAQHQLDGLAADLMRRFPIYRGGNIRLRPAPFTTDIAKSVRPKILALMGAVFFVLLIACANVANLLLVRASLREREFAIRAAIGGSRSRLLQQMLIESATLGILGAAFGLVFARFGIALLLAIAPANIPRLDTVGIDLRVLTFTVLAALVSSLVFGVIPARRASNPDLAVTLRSGGRSMSSGGGARLRQGVVVFEVALSFVLLVGSGLMIRSFIALGNVNPGFEPNNVLTFGVFNNHLRSPGDVRAFADQLQARLHAIPGVVDVTASNPVPLDGSEPGVRWGPTAAADDPSFYRTGTMLVVRSNFFAVMKAKFLAGGTFTAGDNVFGSTAIVIDDLAAARAYPGMALNDIIGKPVLLGEAQPYRVVGIVAHIQQRSLDDSREALYRPDQTSRLYATPFWEIRTAGDPSRIIPEVRRAVGDVSTSAVLAYVNPLSDNVGRAMATTRFSLVLVIVFGAIAALLAAIGLYGVVATTVRERRSEIGIRLALGATSESIMRLILRRGLVLSGVGVVIGIVGALALTRVMSSANMLFGVRPTDPATYVLMAVLFAIIAGCACWLPARSGMNLDPAVTLRSES